VESASYEGSRKPFGSDEGVARRLGLSLASSTFDSIPNMFILQFSLKRCVSYNLHPRSYMLDYGMRQTLRVLLCIRESSFTFPVTLAYSLNNYNIL
jgi:hypothetical protein